jgi:hypothetical protein
MARDMETISMSFTQYKVPKYMYAYICTCIVNDIHILTSGPRFHINYSMQVRFQFEQYIINSGL